MSSFNRKLNPAAKKKSWEEAISHYNLPTGSIEVHIPGDYKPKATTTTLFKPTPVNSKRANKCNAPANRKCTPSPSKETEPSTLTPVNRQPLHYMTTRALLLACGLAALGNLPVYSMVKAPQDDLLHLGEDHADHASPAHILKELNLPAVAVESYSGYALDILPDATQGSWSMRTVDTEDTLESILSEMELSKASQALRQDAAISQALKSLQTGSRLFVQVVEDQLEQLIYTQGGNEAYIVSITDDGYVGKWETGAFEARHSKAAFSVQHSIERDGKNAGLSKSVIRQISQVFQKDMDFKRGVKVGDNVGVIFEDFRYQGESIYTDKILAAEYNNGRKTYQRIRFALADGKVGYFSPDGDAELKRTAFDRKPVNGMMSSGFGMRKHPVFGLRRNHAGIDIAAPHGTPIHATADGTVSFIGRQGGYGNVIELRHSGGISTLYGHMSAFKAGLGDGTKVKRGDVIGYVGSTGTSTGNHVHYEYHVDGQPQNPMTVELPKTGMMSEAEMREFKSLVAAMTQQLTDLRKVAVAKPTANSGG